MPKKRARKSKPQRRRVLHLGFWYFIIAAFFVSLPIVGIMLRSGNQSCANSVSCIKDLSGKFESDTQGVFQGKKIQVPSYVATLQDVKKVLGTTSGPKHISVDLSKQRLLAHEGDNLIYEFPVSTGKWGRTPTGEYKIWIKLLRTRMSGGSGNDYYNLPNVPYVMFFYNNEVSMARGYSIHGAYWHNNFGYTMSHGCINMRPEDAAKIYEWADPVSDGSVTRATNDNPGTTVTIYGEPPS